MNRDQIINELTKIFQAVFEDDEVELTEETSPDDLPDWRSLEHVRLCIEIGQRFNIQMKPSQLARMTTVGGFIDLLSDRLSQGSES
ncbi:hypothetical protein C4J81_18815 (plasmid) [Deltaproteobacteria bacterium Smac51]|nr:hypothetical protein C4J81_18815 [Deltaproteobacteria bacterium Smac51]